MAADSFKRLLTAWVDIHIARVVTRSTFAVNRHYFNKFTRPLHTNFDLEKNRTTSSATHKSKTRALNSSHSDVPINNFYRLYSSCESGNISLPDWFPYWCPVQSSKTGYRWVSLRFDQRLVEPLSANLPRPHNG